MNPAQLAVAEMPALNATVSFVEPVPPVQYMVKAHTPADTVCSGRLVNSKTVVTPPELDWISHAVARAPRSDPSWDLYRRARCRHRARRAGCRLPARASRAKRPRPAPRTRRASSRRRTSQSTALEAAHARAMGAFPSAPRRACAHSLRGSRAAIVAASAGGAGA